MGMSQQELEGLLEFEGLPEYEYEFERLPEYEYELEGEFEGEPEAEEFFGRIANWWRQSPNFQRAVKNVGIQAARGALTGAGRQVMTHLPQAGSYLLDTILPPPSQEYEYEAALAADGEFEANPLDRVSPAALMEHLGHAAAEATSEQEAEAFVGALVPLAAQLIPKVAPVVMRAAPHIIRAVSGATKTLYRNPQTRPLIRTVPTVVRRAVIQVGRQGVAGRPVTPQTVASTIARQTAGIVANPRRCMHAYQQSRALDRRFHQAARRPLVAGRR